MKALAVIAAAFAASLPAAAIAGAKSGLRGEVREGPITPVCRVSEPCDRPAAGVTLSFTRAGRVVRTVKTDANGRYTITLPAAIYTVRTDRGRRNGLAPAHVKVRAGHVDRLDFYIDTGLR